MTVEFWGLLWYQKDGSLEDKVKSAALRYKEKYGEKPNTCFVPNKDITESFWVDGCEVVGAPAVLEHHIWVGIVP